MADAQLTKVAAPDGEKDLFEHRISLDLTPENTMVFGDSLNDISMLEFSHNSVAVANARAETKQTARFTCRSNQEDGVAHFVAEQVLGVPRV